MHKIYINIKKIKCRYIIQSGFLSIKNKTNNNKQKQKKQNSSTKKNKKTVKTKFIYLDDAGNDKVLH